MATAADHSRGGGRGGGGHALLRPRSGLIEPAPSTRQPTSAPRAGPCERLPRAPAHPRAGGPRGFGRDPGAAGVPPAARGAPALERAGRRPVRGGARGAGIAVTLTVVGLPLSAWRHERAVRRGSLHPVARSLAGDVAKATASRRSSPPRRAVAIGLIRRFPRTGGSPGSGVVVGFAVLSLYLSPIVIDPLFNRFEPLPKGELRSDVLRLADRAGVDVGEVYRVDASRRTTAINAYVGGLGHTKRVVLYDNLIEDFPADQVRSVVAHELGHVKGRDLGRGLLWIVDRGARRDAGGPAPERAHRAAGRAAPDSAAHASARPGPAILPAVAFSLALVTFGMTCAGNALSRHRRGAGGRLRAGAHPRPGGLYRARAQPRPAQCGRPRSSRACSTPCWGRTRPRSTGSG